MSSCYTTDTGSVSLKVLDVSWNPIGDDGISLLMEGLMGNQGLTELMVQYCMITVKGT